MTTLTPVSAPRTVEELSAFTSLPAATVDAAMHNISDGSAKLLVMSGKMGSWKDTLAPLVLDTLGYQSYTHRYYADRLKDEVDQMLTHVRHLDSSEQITEYLVHAWDMQQPHANTLAAPLYTCSLDATITARTRTEDTRFILQYYGTNVRRAVDPNHWVKPGLATMLTDIADGASVYVTDARFGNEVDWPTKAGATVVRLHISREEQLRRLTARDGKCPAADALEHRSETALDDYQFQRVIEVDGKPIPQVVQEIVALVA